MENNRNNRNFSSQDNRSNSSEDYLIRASSAVEAGDKTLGIHLYMAAFERAKNENLVPGEKALEGMETAWMLAVDTGQRSLAEYIFEKLEPFWSAEEMARHADQLQKLALDKLEEFGLSREALEDMAELVNQDIIGLPPDLLCHFEEAGELSDVVENEARGAEAVDSEHSELPSSESELSESPTSSDSSVAPSASRAIEFPQIIIPPKKIKDKTEKQAVQAPVRFDYDAIFGFDSAIKEMGKLGIGKDRDPEFRNFVKMLNIRHGLSQMPGVGTLVFRSPSREDANCFMVATVGEMKLPAIRMRLDHNPQGQPVLCVMASADFKARLTNLSRIGFTSPTVLILEDLDQWDLPLTEGSFNSPSDIFQVQISRGAREALTLVHSALESPEVTVFISASHPEEIEDLLLDGIEHYRVVDIDLPSAEERRAVWRAAQSAHPSLRGLDVSQMVEFSATMSRFEIFAVITEAVEHAYRVSLEKGSFSAVHTGDIVSRLSNFQPLDSSEYQEMEDLVVSDFKKSLDSIDDLLEE